MKAELSHGQKALLCLGVSCVSTPKSSHGGKRRPGPETRWQACQLSSHRGPGCPSLEMCAATVNQASLVSKTAGVTCSHQTLPPQHPGDHAWEGWWCERHHSLSPTLTATQITTLGITQSTTITAHLQVALSAEEGRPHGHPPRSSLHLQALGVDSQQASLFNHNAETYRSRGWSPWGCANHTPDTHRTCSLVYAIFCLHSISPIV